MSAQNQMELFKVGKFTVTPTGLTAPARQSDEAWASALTRCALARSSVQWAIGDLLVYAKTAGYDDGLIEATMDTTGLKRGTLLNMHRIAETFPVRETRAGLPWSHFALVAGFEEAERDELLARARRDVLSWEDLRQVTRDLHRQRRVAAMDWPAGQYGVLLSDCPWIYEAGAVPPDRSAERHYPPMTNDELCALAPRVAEVTAPNAVHYMWSTSAQVVSGGAAQVMREWGFDGRSTMVWVKDIMGTGYWARQRHEIILIGVKGDMPPPEEMLRQDSVITSARGAHSEKPVELYEVLERCYPGVPRLELFARGESRMGWARWGNGIDMVGGADRGILIRGDQQTIDTTAVVTA